MPELPEVETVARQLDPLLRARTLRDVAVFDARLGHPETIAGKLDGCVVRGVRRLGKQVLFELLTPTRQSRFVAVHLRMSGRLLAARPDEIAAMNLGPARRWVRFAAMAGEHELVFVDPRRFGTLTFAEGDWAALAPGAVDPTTEAFSEAFLREAAARSRQPMKAFLLRQDVMVGMGNIYASEILFRARVSPKKLAARLSRGEVKRVHEATVAVLAAAIEACGTTFSDFQDAHGVTGSYQQFLAVYGREGEPCRVCGSVIERIVQQQRSTYYCRQCQRSQR